MRHQKGLTTVEYAIAGGLITAAMVGIFPQIGQAVMDRLTLLFQMLTSA